MIPSFEHIWRHTTLNGIPCETAGTEVGASPFTAAFCEVPTVTQNTDDPHGCNLENLQEVFTFFFFLFSQRYQQT